MWRIQTTHNLAVHIIHMPAIQATPTPAVNQDPTRAVRPTHTVAVPTTLMPAFHNIHIQTKFTTMVAQRLVFEHLL